MRRGHGRRFQCVVSLLRTLVTRIFCVFRSKRESLFLDALEHLYWLLLLARMQDKHIEINGATKDVLTNGVAQLERRQAGLEAGPRLSREQEES